jgi:hypothetical protein
MRFVSITGHEYEMWLDGENQIRIDHPDRRGMTVEEYLEFARCLEERPYFEMMETEIRDAILSGSDLLEITLEDLGSLPKKP